MKMPLTVKSALYKICSLEPAGMLSSLRSALPQPINTTKSTSDIRCSKARSPIATDLINDEPMQLKVFKNLKLNKTQQKVF